MKEYHRVSSSDIEIKDRNSLVSYVDKNAEKIIIDGLQPLIPEETFYTEESTVTRAVSEYTWIIDPLDGTTNYLHQIPVFAVSIGLLYQGEIVLGMVYDCTRDDCFSATKGGGAFLNHNTPLQVNQDVLLKDATLATGFPYTDFSFLQDYLKKLGYVMQNSRGLRRLGAAAIDLAYVAAGRFDGFFEYGLNPWDVAGGILLVEEAGGVVRDFGREAQSPLWDGELICGNAAIVQSLQDIF